MHLQALYISIYLAATIHFIMDDLSRGHGITRPQRAIRTAAAAICCFATFVTTSVLAGLTAHALDTATGINDIVIGISPNLPLLLLGYIFSIIAIICVHYWVGHRLIPSEPDDSPDTGTSPQSPSIPPAD